MVMRGLSQGHYPLSPLLLGADPLTMNMGYVCNVYAYYDFDCGRVYIPPGATSALGTIERGLSVQCSRPSLVTTSFARTRPLPTPATDGQSSGVHISTREMAQRLTVECFIRLLPMANLDKLGKILVDARDMNGIQCPHPSQNTFLLLISGE